MKMFTSLVTALVLFASWASAQDMSNVASRTQPTTSSPSTAHDVTGFVSPFSGAPGTSPTSMKTPPNPHPNLKPRVGGVFVDGVKYGAVMISPTAPAEYGMGERYLAAPSQTSSDLQHESGPAAHRDAGGLKLVSFEF